MENPMRERIQARLDALGISAIEAASRAPNMNKFFIYDFMTGRKSSISVKRIGDVAKALSCSPEYLTGSVREIGASPHSMTLSGLIEPGTWRRKQPDLGADLGVTPDDRYPTESQLAFLARGEKLAGIGILDGAIVVATQAIAPRVGDVVVVRNRRKGDGGTEQEITAQKVSKLSECADSDVLGVVIQSIKVF